MQRQMTDVVLMDLLGFMNHFIALLVVGLRGNLDRQFVHLGIAVGAQIELSTTTVTRART